MTQIMVNTNAVGGPHGHAKAEAAAHKGRRPADVADSSILPICQSWNQRTGSVTVSVTDTTHATTHVSVKDTTDADTHAITVARVLSINNAVTYPAIIVPPTYVTNYIRASSARPLHPTGLESGLGLGLGLRLY